MFARALLAHPAVLIADEPTRGVDVGAKRDIYELIVGLAASGVAILLISNEIEEVLGLAHRVLVMRGGPGRRPSSSATGSPRRRSSPRRSAARRPPHEATGRRRGRRRRAEPLRQRRAGRDRPRRDPDPVRDRVRDPGIVSPPFLRFQNLANILDQQAGIIIVAAAGTLVLIAGGIDLSVGAVYGLAGATAAQLSVSFGPPVGITAGILVGLAVGLANGVIVTRFRINPLIGTLAMSFVVGGIGTIATTATSSSCSTTRSSRSSPRRRSWASRAPPG